MHLTNRNRAPSLPDTVEYTEENDWSFFANTLNPSRRQRRMESTMGRVEIAITDRRDW